MDIATLVKALAPAFAAGFAIQRLLEILDPILDRIRQGEYKKIALGLISFAGGLGLAAWDPMRVLSQMTGANVWGPLDYLVTALIISGGTEGFNSIIKFLDYKKQETRETAKAKAITAAAATSALKRRFKMACNYTAEEIEQIVVGVYRNQLGDETITRFSRFGPGKEIDIDSDARRAFFFPIKQNIDRPPDCVITELTLADVQAAKTVGEIIDAIREEFEIE